MERNWEMRSNWKLRQPSKMETTMPCPKSKAEVVMLSHANVLIVNRDTSAKRLDSKADSYLQEGKHTFCRKLFTIT